MRGVHTITYSVDDNHKGALAGMANGAFGHVLDDPLRAIRHRVKSGWVRRSAVACLEFEGFEVLSLAFDVVIDDNASMFGLDLKNGRTY